MSFSMLPPTRYDPSMVLQRTSITSEEIDDVKIKKVNNNFFI